MSKKWLCPKCNIKSSDDVTRCSFCGCPRPADPELAEKHIKDYSEHNLRKSLHYQIEHMKPQALHRVWKWLEDNII